MSTWKTECENSLAVESKKRKSVQHVHARRRATKTAKAKKVYETRALWVFLIRRHTTALGYYREKAFFFVMQSAHTQIEPQEERVGCDLFGGMICVPSYLYPNKQVRVDLLSFSFRSVQYGTPWNDLDRQAIIIINVIEPTFEKRGHLIEHG
jgi:hypothetical protein